MSSLSRSVVCSGNNSRHFTCGCEWNCLHFICNEIITILHKFHNAKKVHNISICKMTSAMDHDGRRDKALMLESLNKLEKCVLYGSWDKRRAELTKELNCCCITLRYDKMSHCLRNTVNNTSKSRDVWRRSVSMNLCFFVRNLTWESSWNASEDDKRRVFANPNDSDGTNFSSDLEKH